jgi:hypothetical protein
MANTFRSDDGALRHSSGTLDGGKFATERLAESVLRTRTSDFLRARREQKQVLRDRLLAEGYRPATSALAASTPSIQNAFERKEFWDTADLIAERGAAADQAVFKMPMKEVGDAHRTHRMSYGNDQIEIRMPAVKAVKDARRAHKVNTIDIPVAAEFPGKHPYEGVVRVTETKPGSYLVTGGNDVVNEAVASLYEARRVTSALSGVDLREKAAARAEARGVTPVPLVSKFLERASFNGRSGVLAVTIRGKQYGYPATAETFNALINPENKAGQIFNRMKTANPSSISVSTCDDCGRDYQVNGVAHTCDHVTGDVGERGAREESFSLARAMRSSLRAVGRNRR